MARIIPLPSSPYPAERAIILLLGGRLAEVVDIDVKAVLAERAIMASGFLNVALDIRDNQGKARVSKVIQFWQST